MKSHYTIIIEPDDGGGLAYIPAIRGCHALGDTLDEALEELEVVLRCSWKNTLRRGVLCPVTSRSQEVPSKAEEVIAVAERLGFGFSASEGVADDMGILTGGVLPYHCIKDGS